MHEINETNYDGYLKLYQIYPLIRTKIIKKSIMKLLAYLIGILIIELLLIMVTIRIKVNMYKKFINDLQIY